MGYNIGFFKATNSGYEGKIETLLHKITATFHRVVNRTNQNAPAYEIYCGELRIGAAWERTGKYGKYLSVSFEDPSFSSGSYYFSRNNGVDDGYTLTFKRSKSKTGDKPEAAQAA
jgi:uncharacterized protein (DUF736 family)